jgi:hypothetical protein
LKDPKTKAFWAAAFKAMFTDEDDDNGDEEQEETNQHINEDQARADDDKGDGPAAEDMRSFLSMVGSLKE